MIICGYAGIGKSYLAHNYPNIIDLESTPFEKDWDRYYKCAKHYSNQGYLVLLSCHKEIRERVLSMPYGERITIFPCIEDKELFRKRYEQRGNNEEFIKLQMDNWEKWTSENNRLLGEHLEYMESGETLYDTIIRLSKLNPNRFYTYGGCPVYDCSLMKERVDGYQTDDGILDHKCAITAVDKLYKQKPAEWSEEDESNFQMLIDLIKENKHHATDYEHMKHYKLLSWFKSLKERYVWKPSDEQTDAL